MSRDEMNLRLSGLQTMEILLEIEKVAKKYSAKLKKFWTPKNFKHWKNLILA